jgi:hypothetical protein
MFLHTLISNILLIFLFCNQIMHTFLVSSRHAKLFVKFRFVGSFFIMVLGEGVASFSSCMFFHILFEFIA